MAKQLVEKLKGGLIVSCQAYPNWPMYGSEIMARLALAAKEGGALGIRACWADNISAIKAVCDLPVVGINKVIKGIPSAADVIITPDFEAARCVVEAGCDILGLDCTPRGRSYQDIADLVKQIQTAYPGLPLMADISTLEEGLKAAELGIDIISTTLSGYTSTSLGLSEDEARTLTSYPEGLEPPPDFDLVKQLRAQTDKYINAEGRIWDLKQLRQAFEAGADMVTIGTAITAPQLITKRFVQSLTNN